MSSWKYVGTELVPLFQFSQNETSGAEKLEDVKDDGDLVEELSETMTGEVEELREFVSTQVEAIRGDDIV